MNVAQLNRIERKVDAILEHLGISFDDNMLLSNEASKEVADLLRQGKKINAIKVYREQTGAGLKEAKEAIDEFSSNGQF